MQKLKYVEGFSFIKEEKGLDPKPGRSHALAGRVLNIHFDDNSSEILEFINGKEITVDGDGAWNYELLPVASNLYLLTIHMLAKELPQYYSYVLDLDSNLVTRIVSKITTIQKGSTKLSDTTNLVVRAVLFGYIGNMNPIQRHHYTNELTGLVLETTGSPGNVVRYYIHCETKITYYQQVWPLNGNPIDKEGVGFGEAIYLQIRSGVFLIMFTKHSHGNQPMILWNSYEENYAANFGGVSRQLECPFVVTAGAYMRVIAQL